MRWHRRLTGKAIVAKVGVSEARCQQHFTLEPADPVRRYEREKSSEEMR